MIVYTALINEGTTVLVVGRANEISTGFPSAIEAEGWRWAEIADIAALSPRTLPRRTLIVMKIAAFTAATQETIQHLAVSLGLPVVVFGKECSPEIVDAVLRTGADEFLPLPVMMEEMIARLAAVVRVRLGAQRERLCSEYQLDEAARTVTIGNGTAIRLSVSEYRLLRMLLASPNRPVARARLATMPMLLSTGEGTDAIDTAIHRLSKKLGADRIKEIRGHGFLIIDRWQRPDNLTSTHDTNAAPEPVAGCPE